MTIKTSIHLNTQREKDRAAKAELFQQQPQKFIREKNR
jgi:hypothetical protein